MSRQLCLSVVRSSSCGKCAGGMLYNLFLICASLGGTMFICLFLLQLMGLGGHHTGVHSAPGSHAVGGHHSGFRGHLLRGLGVGRAHSRVAVAHQSNPSPSGHPAAGLQSWLSAMFSFQGLVAGTTAFGLVGLAASSQGWTVLLVFPLACVGGIGASLFVAAALHILLTMDSDGTLHTEDMVGAQGTVYLSIPAGNAGLGKVVVHIQGRTAEFNAVSFQSAELKAGDDVVVVGVQKSGTLEVASAASVPTKVDL